MSDVDYEHKFREVARLQHAEIERLHGELDQMRIENQRLVSWIMGDEPDALATLQRIYSDPKTPQANVIKTAIRLGEGQGEFGAWHPLDSDKGDPAA
jgi:hypothetical protein